MPIGIKTNALSFIPLLGRNFLELEWRGIKKWKFKKELPFIVSGDLGEARTLDPLIKSQLLYQLSYEVIVVLLISVAKVRLFF